MCRLFVFFAFYEGKEPFFQRFVSFKDQAAETII